MRLEVDCHGHDAETRVKVLIYYLPVEESASSLGGEFHFGMVIQEY
jgi:hypothetical protein